MKRLWNLIPWALSVAALGVALSHPGGAAEPEAGHIEPTGEVQVEPPASSGAVELENKIAALEWTVSNLVDRVSALERSASAPRPEGAAPPEVDRRQLDALRSDVDALLTGEALGTDAGRQRLKEVVRSLQDEVFAERIRERAAAREQARAERLKRFVEEARLTSTQEQDIVRALEDEGRQRQAWMEARRAGQGQGRPGFGELRALRQRTDEAAQRILSPDQYVKYEEMRREERQDRGGWRRERRADEPP